MDPSYAIKPEGAGHPLPGESLSLLERLHYHHRFLRYRFRTEQDTIHFIKRHLLSGSVALDIGANKGIVTYFLSRQTGAEGKVIAFEPQMELIPHLNKVRNSFALSNVELVPLALSDRNGVATLHRHCAGSTGTIDAPSEGQNEVVEIETTTLDDFVTKHGIERVDFVKCDVDGYEMPVLQGARNTLERLKPAVVIEIFEDAIRPVSDYLYGLGYSEGVFLYRGKTFPESKSATLPYRHATAKFRNFLFLPESHD